MEDLHERLTVYTEKMGTSALPMAETLMAIRAELHTEAVPNWRRFELERDEIRLEHTLLVLNRIERDLKRLLSGERV